jgi:hypothetical protein
MRVLLPVHHNSNEDYDYEDEEEEELLATEAPPDHARAPDPPPPQILHCRTALAFQGADSTPLPPVEKFGAPVTDDQKKRPAVVASRKRAYSPFQVPSPNEEGPKKVCVKPPPPSYKSTNMTAPRYPEEEARTLPHDHGGEVLENEPPPVAASAGGNHAVRNGAAARNNDPTEDDEAYATTPVPVAQDVFAQALKAGGLEIVDQEGDGNCLFRAVSLQVYGDSNMHQEVRTRCLDFMAVNEEHFGQFVTGEAFGDYLARKRLDGVHGNNPEIQAISELFNRPVEVFTPDTGGLPLNIFHAEYSTSDIPIRLSYHDGNHYNAVIDPIKPTAGLGLGLPGLQPGLADKQQMATAVAASDQQMDLEKAIQESQQDMSQDYDDDLQRALKESSESVAYVSFGGHRYKCVLLFADVFCYFLLGFYADVQTKSTGTLGSGRHFRRDGAKCIGIFSPDLHAERTESKETGVTW